MGAYVGARPAAAILRRIEQTVGHIFDVGAHTDLFPKVGDDRLGLFMIAPLGGDAKLELHLLAFTVGQHAVRAGLPPSFRHELLGTLHVILINRRDCQRLAVDLAGARQRQVRYDFFALEKILRHGVTIDGVQQRAPYSDITEPRVVTTEAQPTPRRRAAHRFTL